MLNCIGNGEDAVSLMNLGSFVNHRGYAANAVVQTGGCASRHRIGFVARNRILEGDEVTISYYGHDNMEGGHDQLAPELKARVLQQFMIDELIQPESPGGITN